MLNYDDFRTETIIDRTYSLLSTAEILQKRTVDNILRTTSFYKRQNLDDLKRLKTTYNKLALCVKLGQRIDFEVNQDSIQLPITVFVIIDLSLEANSQLEAELQSERFHWNVIQVLLNNKHYGNLLFKDIKSFQSNRNQNSNINEVSWRIFVETEFK